MRKIKDVLRLKLDAKLSPSVMINVSITSSYRTKAMATYTIDLQQFKNLIGPPATAREKSVRERRSRLLRMG